MTEISRIKNKGLFQIDEVLTYTQIEWRVTRCKWKVRPVMQTCGDFRTNGAAFIVITHPNATFSLVMIHNALEVSTYRCIYAK